MSSPIFLEDHPRSASASTTPQRTNPLARVFDELRRFCESRSLFMLHYCTGAARPSNGPLSRCR